MKKCFFVLLFLAGTATVLTAAPAAEEKGNEIILRNSGAEYTFAKDKFYQLKESRYKGRLFWVKNFGLTYNIPGDRWYWEDKPYELYKMAPRTHKVVRKGDALTLETRGIGKNMTLIRNFTLRGNSPDLEVQVRLEVRDKNIINWLNLFSTSFPLTNEYWTLVSRVKNGKVVTAMEKEPYPFVDPKTKNFRVRGNYRRHEYQGQTFICAYDRKNAVGAILMQRPELSRLPLRVGQAKPDAKVIYCNVSPRSFSGTPENSFLDAHYLVVPFTGEPALLNKSLVPAFIAKMQKVYALPKSYDTALLLKRSGTLSIWSDLSSQKVYPDAPAPVKKASQVELFAARSEGEGFNLAFRSSKAIKNITWEISALPGKVEAFPVQLINRDTLTGIIGDHPDVLTEEKSFDLAPNKTSVLYVKISVPENAKAGVYSGKVKLFENKKVLAEIPVRLTVRDFSVSERTLTAAHDFWWRKYGFAKDQNEYAKQSAKIRDMVIDARGGRRWLSKVDVTFDAQGNLTKADYKAFD